MKQELEQIIAAICKDVFSVDVQPELTRPDEQFGDYATNVAMQIVKQAGKNPREIAEILTVQLQTHEHVLEASVAGPGFINLRLTDSALLVQAGMQPTKLQEGMTIVIETNNPNPFKAMHIGHAFNAILADTIANLLEVGGANVYRVSYHGDVGLHVGKSMYSLLRYVDGKPEKLQDVPEAERNSFMSRMYSEGSRAYNEDEQAKTEIEELTKQSFTREDPVYGAVYDICRDWSFGQIEQNVARLGNQPTERRFLESDAELRGVKIVRDNVPKVFKESDGALVFEGSKHGSFDNAFVSKRGTGLYAARDLGLMQLKNEYYHPHKSYIVTAEEQRDYFRGVIAAAELCFPEQKGVTVNIPHGTVKLTTGKMSSRDGDVIEIDWLFDQVAAAIEHDTTQLAEATERGALRYEFLKIRIGGDVIFDINEAVSIKGNSGPYVQYAHARAKSILAKADWNGELKQGAIDLEPAERLLVRQLGMYGEVVERATAELLPHLICNYLYELAQEFNRFYEHNRVVGDEREAQRLQLVALYAQTLEQGLSILGIPAPDTM